MDKRMDLAALAERLGRVRHFQHLAASDCMAIVSAGTIRTFPAGSLIFREGEPCAGMWVLFSGHVHLNKLGPNGRQSLVTSIDPVIMFNEVTVIDGGVNLTTAVAVQDCTMWQIDHEHFQGLLHRYPEVGLGLLRVLATRTRLLMSHYEDLSFRSVLARTAKMLLDLSSYGKQPIDRSEHPNSELAARISTVPEALSRSLQVFKKTGDIASSRTTIMVCAPSTLAELAKVDPDMFKG